MTDTTPEPEEIAVAALTKKQSRRMFAMTASKDLLTLPASSAGMFGVASKPMHAIVDAEMYVPNLIELSEYLLNGVQRAEVEPVRGFGLAIPTAFLERLFGGDEGEENIDEAKAEGE